MMARPLIVGEENVTTRLKNLQKLARRRGCEQHELTSERFFDPEAGQIEIIYWLFVLDYKDPVEFDDLDDVEFDLNSRPVVKRAAA